MDSSGRTMFPVLKNSTILKIMEEVKVPLTEMELTEPGRCKERVREVFVQLLCICRGETETELFSIPNRVKHKQAKLVHPELHNDSFRESKFYDLLQKQLRICGYNEFGFKDLALPAPKRFKRQLSALINFLKYREDMAHLEISALEEREELFAAVDEVSDIHMTLKGQLEEARAAHERGMMERAEAEAEVKEMEAEIAQQNKIQASIRQETYLLKKSANELKDQIANLSIALRDLQAEERQLSKEIVHSPDRIKVDLADAIQKLERVKKTIVEKQNEKHTVQKMLKHTASAEESVRQVITTDLRELETKVKAYKLAVKELNEAQNKLRGMEEDLEEKKQVKEMQMKQLEAVEKRKAETKATLTKILQSTQIDLNKAKAELSNVESQRLEGISRLEASQQRVKDLISQMELEKKKNKEEIEGMISSFHEFDKRYWAKEEPFLQLISSVGDAGLSKQ